MVSVLQGATRRALDQTRWVSFGFGVGAERYHPHGSDVDEQCHCAKVFSIKLE